SALRWRVLASKSRQTIPCRGNIPSTFATGGACAPARNSKCRDHCATVSRRTLSFGNRSSWQCATPSLTLIPLDRALTSAGKDDHVSVTQILLVESSSRRVAAQGNARRLRRAGDLPQRRQRLRGPKGEGAWETRPRPRRRACGFDLGGRS